MVEFVHSGVWIVWTSEVSNLLLFAKISWVFRVKFFFLHPKVRGNIQDA